MTEQDSSGLVGRPDQLGAFCRGVWISVQSTEEDPGGHSGCFFSPWAQGIIAWAYVTSPTAQGSTKINNNGPRHHTFSSTPAQNEGVNNTPRGDLENHKLSHAHIYKGVCVVCINKEGGGVTLTRALKSMWTSVCNIYIMCCFSLNKCRADLDFILRVLIWL